jgi:hypothetical protein
MAAKNLLTINKMRKGESNLARAALKLVAPKAAALRVSQLLKQPFLCWHRRSLVIQKKVNPNMLTFA